MKKIPIRKPKNKPIKLVSNVVSRNNEDIIVDMILEYQSLIGNPKQEAFYDDILDNLYRLIENTNCKYNLIYNHNKNFKRSRKLMALCGSKPATENNGNTIDDSDSPDIVTKCFKSYSNVSTEEKMQAIAFWSNRIAHGCSVEIENFAEYFLESSKDDYEAKCKRKEFAEEIYNIHKKFDTEPKYRFSQPKVLNMMQSQDFDFNTCNDQNFLTVKNLMNDFNIKCDNKEDVRNFIYCNKLQDMTDNFYALKDNAVVDVVKYLSGPGRENSNIIALRVSDNNMVNKDKESLSRIILVNREIYEEYFKFNDSLSFSYAFIDNSLDKNKIGTKEKLEACRNMLRGKLVSENRDRMISDNILNALMQLGAVSVFHIPDKELEKYGIDLPEVNSPLIECMANYGAGIFDIAASPVTKKGLKNFLAEQRERCMINKQMYDDDYERFCYEKSIKPKAKRHAEEIQQQEGIMVIA